MSFGFGVGDFIAVGQLAWTLYRDCYTIARNAPQEFQLLLGEISTLCNSLKLLEEEVKSPQSALVRAGEDRVRMVNEMVAGIRKTLEELQKVATRYNILGSASKAKHVWMKLKWSAEFKSVDSLRSKLVYHNTVMSLLLTSVGNSSLGRIETSTKTLESDIADIKSHLQTSHDKSSNSPPLASMVEDEVYKLSLSAEFMKNAESLQPWSSISVEKWVQSGKWWLLRSQMELHAPAKPNDHSVPVSAYTNLIKASWILVDIIDHHPQLPLVTTGTRHEVLLLAAELKREFRRISDLGLATPDWQIIEQQDLRIWENNTKGPVLQPGKRTQKTDLVQTQTDFWVVRGEQVYFQRFALHQRSNLSEPQTCVVLFLVHENERAGRLVAQDQNESTLMEFKLQKNLLLGFDESSNSLEMGYDKISTYSLRELKRDITSLKIGADTLTFSTTADGVSILTLIESANLYLFRRGNDTLDLGVFRGFAYLNNDLCVWGVHNGLVGVIRVFLTEGASIDMERCLCYAVEQEKEDIVEILLENGADPDGKSYLKDEDGYKYDWPRNPPLHQASSKGHLMLTQMLLEKGADINAKNGWGQTALYLASREGHETVIDLLIARKEIDVNVRIPYNESTEEGGTTPLHQAVRWGYYDIAHRLLERGANANITEASSSIDHDMNPGYYHCLYTWKRTPLHLAIQMPPVDPPNQELSLSMVQLLLLYSADINAEAEEEEEMPAYEYGHAEKYGHISGITPLHFAIRMGHKKVMRFLLESGARRDQRAVELAKKHECDEIVQLLQEVDIK